MELYASNYILQMVKAARLQMHLKTPHGQLVWSGCVKNYLWIFCTCIAIKTIIQMWQCHHSRNLLSFITRFPCKTLKRIK